VFAEDDNIFSVLKQTFRWQEIPKHVASAYDMRGLCEDLFLASATVAIAVGLPLLLGYFDQEQSAAVYNKDIYLTLLGLTLPVAFMFIKQKPDCRLVAYVTTFGMFVCVYCTALYTVLYTEPALPNANAWMLSFAQWVCMVYVVAVYVFKNWRESNGFR